jgi:sugar (pentulose or hexulose) kinase/phosphoglycerate dehydrogenase-like enzyme
MGRALVMAFDLGGGSGRCLLADLATGEVFTGGRSWSPPVAPDTAGLGFDLDLDEMWLKLGEASRQVMGEAGAGSGEVMGVAACSMRNTTILLDGEGRAVFATPNKDARALGSAMMLAAERGMEVYGVGGHWPSPLFTGTRMLWLQAEAPKVLERARRAVALSDWMGFRMSGELVAERSQAGETLLLDQRSGNWAFDLIESLGIDTGLFPELVDAGTRIGGLTGEAAEHLGLKPGTPVAAAGPDTQCGLLGMACVRGGEVGISAGTSMPLQQVTGDFLLDGEGRLWSGRHAVPGLFVVESNGMTPGTALEWFSRVLYPGNDKPLLALSTDAERSEPGAHGVYSTLGAWVFDARVTGVLQGSLTMSHMVTPDTSTCRAHISRALLEGIAYSARANLEQVLSVTGLEPARVAVGGGMAKGAAWCGILSDVLGRKVTVPASTEVSALGTAVCAAVCAGLLPDLAEGARALFRPGVEHEPGHDSERYQGLYAGWREAVEKRAECDSHVAGQMAMAMLSRPPAPCEAPAAMRPRILVTASMDEVALDELQQMGEVTYLPWRERGKIFGGARDLAEALDGFDVFVTEMDIVDYEALEELPGLKLIISCRVNPVNVDLEAATAFGIPVANTPGRNADAVADLTVAFMIMLARKLPGASAFLKKGDVEEGDLARMGEAYHAFQGRELWRKTVGLIGLGSVGARVASRLKPFGARVLFCDPAVRAGEGALAGVEKVSFEKLLEQSDFVSVHAPASEATEGIMDREAFMRMKKGALFVNTSRASLVDDGALAEALESGRLAGAALDVFTVEPPGPDDPLASREDVIATPHIGGNTEEIGAHQGETAALQVGDMLRGEAPGHILNPAVMEWFSWTGPRREPSPGERERLAARPKPSITS